MKSIEATIQVDIWDEELDTNDISDQIESLGWGCSSVLITHSDYDESESED